MGYEPNNNYILENDVEEANNPSFEKEMKRAAKNNNGLPEGYEIEESSRKKTVQEEYPGIPVFILGHSFVE